MNRINNFGHAASSFLRLEKNEHERKRKIFERNDWILKKYSKEKDVSISGKEFKEKYPENEFCKVFKGSLKHHNMCYKEGLNINVERFIPFSNVNYGGMFFADKENISEWFSMYPDLEYMAEVTIPDDARVVEMGGMFKTDRIILNNFQPISNYKEHDEKFWLKKVLLEPFLLKLVKNQTFDICWAAGARMNERIEENKYLARNFIAPNYETRYGHYKHIRDDEMWRKISEKLKKEDPLNLSGERDGPYSHLKNDRIREIMDELVFSELI